jgi:hypothetical protein
MKKIVMEIIKLGSKLFNINNLWFLNADAAIKKIFNKYINFKIKPHNCIKEIFPLKMSNFSP